MTQPFLYMRTRGTDPTQYAVFKEFNMQLTQIGADFGTNEAANINTAYNRVANWGNDLFAIGQDEIWKWDTAAGGPWTSFHTYAQLQAGASQTKIGFTATSLDGSGVLTMAYPSDGTGNPWRFVYIDRDQNTREGNEINISAISNITGHIVSNLGWRNNVAFRMHDGGNVDRVIVYDAVAETFTLAGSSASHSMHASQLCISNDNIYYAMCNRNGNPHLIKVVGSLLVNQGTLTTDITMINNQYPFWGSAICEVDDKLFSFIPGDAGEGFFCIQSNMDAAGDMIEAIDVSSVVLPTSLSNLGTGSTTHASIRVDNITNSGTLPIYELMVYNGSVEGGTPTLYRWDNAPSGQMVLVDGGLDNYQYSLISATDGTSGEKIWSGSGVINASSPVMTVDGVNINAEFVIYGASQPGVSLELHFDKEGEVISERGTIVSTTVGSIVSNTVTGLVADGTTKVIVGWAAATDGIVSGDNPKVAARVFIP